MDSKTSGDGLDEFSITTEQLGVWQVSTIKQPKFNPQSLWGEVIFGLRLFCRLATEVSTISYTMLILFVLSKLWEGVEQAILMQLSSSLLQILEAVLRDGQANNAFAVSMAIVNRLSCVALFAILNWWTNHYNPVFQTRVTQYYEAYLMRDPDSAIKVSPDDVWRAFDEIMSFIGEILTSASQLTLIVHVSRSSGGPFFAFLCVAKPLVKVMFERNVWSLMWVVNLNHADYQRMDALNALTTDSYRQDFITGNLGNHILREHEKAKERLGDTCTDDFWTQIFKRSSPLFDVTSAIAGDLPMFYCAVNALVNPSKFSIASIAVLQQSSTTLRYSFHGIINGSRTFQRHIVKLKNLYEISEKPSLSEVGHVPYPNVTTSEDGMSFELKGVTFSYPGSKTKSPALDKVSLTIKSGQLVVIVGANGSGKSTIIKLLTRLYDPSAGTLLIDSLPAQEYCPSDFRQAMASFTQDHNIFPLSLYENISLGNVARSDDKAAVALAAKQGGAADFINKFEDGIETLLDPRSHAYPLNLPDDPEHPLKKKLKMVSKKIDISGGEKQRLVASRTFMRLSSGNVKFVAVDEPSSALDPKAEKDIFDHLLADRAGKTMVFVTHRFGHLTKHADLIICMKDGSVAESGSHEQLMDLKGEYAKLYQIQADAFSSSSS